MSIIKVSQNPRRVKPDTTPEERAARVDAFKHLTQDHYDHLLKIVRLVVPGYLCDPTEALSEGLLAATRMYNGETCISTYVTKCALNYAIRAGKKAARQIQFADLSTDEHADDDNATAYIDETISIEDSRYIEAIDDQFIERINDILADMESYHKRHARPKVIALASEILDVLRTNANLGTGIGVDEYDDAPLKAPEWENQSQVHRNTLEPRARIHDHLARMLGADNHNVAYAMIALRLSTKQALHEGWLPC